MVVVAAALQLAAPRAVHAVVSALVTVANTSANPVPVVNATENPSQIMELYTDADEGKTAAFAVVNPASGVFSGESAFVVPPGQVFVITEIELTITGSSASIPRQAVLVSGSLTVVRDYWTIAGSQTMLMVFRSGIVFAAGTTPALVNYDGIPGGIVALARGYLATA